MSRATEIRNAIAANGILRARNTNMTKTGSLLFPTDHVTRLEPLCWDATYSANGTSIELSAVPVGTLGADCCIIGNGTEVAAGGQISPPGVIFSDYFSGCLFFLFRDSWGSVYGVHSYRSGGTYPDPTPYFDRIGAKLLYFFDTGGRFSVHGADVFGSVICNITNTRIIIDFCAIRGNGNILLGVDHQVIDNWKVHPGIAAPAVGGALAPYDPAAFAHLAVQSPKKSGLKQRVASFLLDYC